MTEKMGLIGPEVSDRAALDLPLDRAEILVTNGEILKKTREDWRALPGVDQIQVVGLERGGVPIPIGVDTRLQRMDLVTIVGVKSAVEKVGDAFGRVVRPSAATDLLTLSAGMILGFLIGAIQFPALEREATVDPVARQQWRSNPMCPGSASQSPTRFRVCC
jgi:putative transport protein